MSEPYHLVVKAQARRALEHQLAPSTAATEVARGAGHHIALTACVAFGAEPAE